MLIAPCIIEEPRFSGRHTRGGIQIAGCRASCFPHSSAMELCDPAETLRIGTCLSCLCSTPTLTTDRLEGSCHGASKHGETTAFQFFQLLLL